MFRKENNKNIKDDKNENYPNNTFEKKLFKKKKSDFLAEALSLPSDTFRNLPSIHIRGNREIIIDGCMGLLSYSAESITVETKFCKMVISGKSLGLHNLSDKIVSVRGYIQKFEFTM